MHTHIIPDPERPFSMRELEQIESAIKASRQSLALLEGRHAALTEELDRITRPQPASSAATSKTVGRGLEYRGAWSNHWSCIAIHIDLLRRMWNDFPDQREKMAIAIGHHGSTRAYVAKSLTELFPRKPAVWARRHSRPLVEGWLVDTNLNPLQMRKILRAAVEAAGLTWGAEVKVYWRSTEIRAPAAHMTDDATRATMAHTPRPGLSAE
jgi:hypothetical protein